jgi:hypothetical protein
VWREELADGSWAAARCTGGSAPGAAEVFTIVGLELVRGGPAISFTQRYPDGEETVWRAVLDADHSLMSGGTWRGQGGRTVIEGAFCCQRQEPDAVSKR